MRVLVLGATGFIGTRVVDELVLRHGAEVRATVRDYRKAVRLGRLPVEWVEARRPNRRRCVTHPADATASFTARTLFHRRTRRQRSTFAAPRSRPRRQQRRVDWCT